MPKKGATQTPFLPPFLGLGSLSSLSWLRTASREAMPLRGKRLFEGQEGLSARPFSSSSLKKTDSVVPEKVARRACHLPHFLPPKKTLFLLRKFPFRSTARVVGLAGRR
jgi:hypothetical protein